MYTDLDLLAKLRYWPLPFHTIQVIYPSNAKALDDDPLVAAWICTADHACQFRPLHGCDFATCIPCRKKTKTLATDCFIPKSSVVINMAVNSTIKDEGDVYKQNKNQEGEWTDGAKCGLNVAKYVKDFIGLTSAWMLGDVYTCEYRKIPTLIAKAVKTADLTNMSLTPGISNHTRGIKLAKGKPIVKLLLHRRLHKGDDITQAKWKELGFKTPSDRLSEDEQQVKHRIRRYIPVRDLQSDAQ